VRAAHDLGPVPEALGDGAHRLGRCRGRIMSRHGLA
jgi:hypothetical protein